MKTIEELKHEIEICKMHIESFEAAKDGINAALIPINKELGFLKYKLTDFYHEINNF